MPTPGANESQSDYLKRCIPIVLKEGTAKSQDQAVAICSSMFREHAHKRDIVAATLKYLEDNDPVLAKLMAEDVTKDMTAGDVHASTALGNGDDKKKKEEEVDVDKVDYPLVITKIDAEQQKVFGWASVSMRGGKVLVDKQNDMILPDDLEMAAHDYALHWRSQGDMHKLDGEGNPVRHGRLIESMVFTPDKMAKAGLSAIDPTTGEQLFGWFVAFKVDDQNLWEAHKRGERPEFSIGGKGRRVDVA